MEKHGNKILVIIGLFFVGLLGFSAGYAVRDGDIIEPPAAKEPVCGVEEEFDTFFEVMNILEEDHYSQPSREDLILGAIEGMIASLDDPYTTYFDYEEAQAFSDKFGETYVGVGIGVRYQNGTLIIDEVFSGSPAEEAGLQVNDIITHVDGDEVTGLEFYQIVQKIIGNEGTNVVIGVYRQGFSETLYFEITRGVIDNPSVEYEVFEEDGKKIGYIKVGTFGDETFELFSQAVEALDLEGIDGLVIDVRNNGGGHLFTVFYMMQVFLVYDGNPMFMTEHYVEGFVQPTNYNSSNDEVKPYDIVTLVNGNSASASEVFASAMQEQGDYKLVGTKTFGKGTMQTDKYLSTTIQDSIHITIGRWLTSEGNWVNTDGGTGGITPDIIIEPNPAELVYKVFLTNETEILFDSVDVRIANLQVFFKELGYDVRTDGYFDEDTRAAIIDIQSQNSLTVDGILDEQTLEVINTMIHEYQNDPANDAQLQAAIDYLTE